MTIYNRLIININIISKYNIEMTCEESKFDHFEFECATLDSAGQDKPMNDGTLSYNLSGTDAEFADINKGKYKEDFRFYSPILREILQKKHGPQCKRGMLWKRQENRISVRISKVNKDGTREKYHPLEFWMRET